MVEGEWPLVHTLHWSVPSPDAHGFFRSDFSVAQYYSQGTEIVLWPVYGPVFLRYTTQLISPGSGHTFLFLGILLSFFSPSSQPCGTFAWSLKNLSSYLSLLRALLLGFWELKLGFSWEPIHALPEALNMDLNGRGREMVRKADTEGFLKKRDDATKYHLYTILGFS